MTQRISSTTFARTPSGGVLRLNSTSPQQQLDPRTGQRVSSTSMQPNPWAPSNQPSLGPLGTSLGMFDHPRTPPDSPPALIWSQSPYATIPLPQQVDVSVSMNPLLKYGSPYLIRYDITTAPGIAIPPPYCTASQWLREPATKPNMRTFTIRLAALDRPIVIQASNHIAVTVYDVLVTVYNTVLNVILSAAQYYYHGDMAAAMQAVFGGRKIWAGLEESTTEPDVWVLHVR